MDENLIFEGDFTEVGGYHAMLALLPEKPDAVFVASDSMALGAMRAIQENGLHIPEDVAVIGFDGIAQGSRCVPTLSTIRQPIQEMGACAAEAVIDMILNPGKAPKKIILKTDLILRESTGN